MPKKHCHFLLLLRNPAKQSLYKDLSIILTGDGKYAHPLMNALGRLGKGLEILSERQKKFRGIPPIQLLVCNQSTSHPGNRALSFLGFERAETDRMTKRQLDSLVLAAHQRIFLYKYWHDVLKALDLKPVTFHLPSPQDVISKIRELGHTTKEGDDHKRLKLFIAQNPKKIGIKWNGHGETECLL